MSKPHPNTGNQYALGNKGGRPRVFEMSEEECKKLGEDLLEWAKKPDSLLMSMFYCVEKHIARDNWKLLVVRDEFSPYYKEAQALLAQKCINGGMEKSFGHRYIRLYDRELREDEDETARFNHDLKMKEQLVVSEEDRKRHDEMMSQIKQLQGSSSSLYKEENNISTDTKS